MQARHANKRLEINDPAAIAELTKSHEVYERALIDNGTGVDTDVLRREIRRLDIMTFGDSAGIVSLEYVRHGNGEEQHGRETQFWFRFEGGWKMVSLLLDPKLGPPAEAAYLNAASAEIGLGIDAEYQSDANADLNRLAGVAGFLMQFPLPEEVEAAPVFQP